MILRIDVLGDSLRRWCFEGIQSDSEVTALNHCGGEFPSVDLVMSGGGFLVDRGGLLVDLSGLVKLMHCQPGTVPLQGQD